MAGPHLNRALVLEAQERTPDGAGGDAVAWAALGTLWAEVVAGTGRDPEGEEVILTSQPFRITVRAALPGAMTRPVAGQRFREGTRVFPILAVAECDRDGRFLLCICREEAPV